MHDKKILLIGLEKVFAGTLTVALRERGAEVDCLGGETIDLPGGAYDVLLIDVVADLALIKRLKSVSPDTWAVIMADTATVPSPADIIRLGGDDYFMKSRDVGYLLLRLGHCLRYLTSRQEMLAQHDQLEKEIAAKNAAKEELRQRLIFYQTLMNAGSSPLYVVDINDFTVKWANRACYFHNDYEGRTCHQLTHGRDTPCNGANDPCTIAEIKKTGKSVVVEHTHIDDRGKETIVEVHSSPIFADDGKLIQVVENCIDITERTQLQSQLRHAQKMESIATMAAGIAHDFNNILTVILGFSDLAHSLLEDDNELKAYLLEVIKAGRRARALIAQILSFSRGKELAKQPVLLNPIVKETVKLLKASLPSTIELRFNIDPECGMVMAEPTQIHQVLMNLCSNAFQAMESEGGTLEINMERLTIDEKGVAAAPSLRPGVYICLRVIDNGPGMDPFTMDRIFEPYFTTKAQGQGGPGSGLGLSVAHGIINAHKGVIMVSSKLGQGSVFSIYLPEIAMEMETDQQVGLPVAGGGDEHIIFVDDEGSIAGLGKKILEKLGYKVTVFTDSIKALAAIKSAPDKFDILVSDLTMPHLTGLGLAREIKQADIKLPVIIISGYSLDRNLADEAAKYGVRAVLKKPFEYEGLAQSIREALTAAA
ncbi:MAG: response regulator [Deltaproteobacteria bacterium]|nr:response regulator [Deltaproteobacteria bacterium]